MKKFTIPCLAVAISTASNFLMSYAEGRAGRPFSFFLLPAAIIPLLISISSLLLLCILALIALIKKHQARAAFVAVTLSIIFAATWFIIPADKIFRVGFRQRIKTTISIDELRGIARACHDSLPVNGLLPGPEKRSLWAEEEHRPVWVALTKSTSLGKLDPWMVIKNYSDSVVISWGGALAGHWGVRIQIEQVTTAGDIAPDITTFVSD